ncbi:helix-turn-helix transcriptional regulator [Ruegeria sp.]|uniref:helix-turn-helix transcriptional regulator n=1 Tax=Ruegeria sp. TaxID=1879320 RepID=UPI003B5C8886
MDLGTEQRRAWFPNAQHTKAIISFIQWSQGGIVLDAALAAIVEAFGADCGVISRSWLNKNGERVASRADTRDQSNKRPLFLSHTNDILGPFTNKPKRASVFSFLDEGKDVSDLSAVVTDWFDHRNLRDILFICLDNHGNELDFLELHFCRNCNRDYREGIEAVAGELSEIYRNRRPGLITEALSRQSLVKLKRPVEDALIMSTENPAKLTRAEWRVCVLISRGLSAQAIGAELGIGPATVRTHLKHVYSKTGLDSFHMLARRLVSLEEREALHGIQYQARA